MCTVLCKNYTTSAVALPIVFPYVFGHFSVIHSAYFPFSQQEISVGSRLLHSTVK